MSALPVAEELPGAAAPEENVRFATVGPVTASTQLPQLRMARPLPGFPALTRFVLVSVDGPSEAADAGEEPPAPLLYELRSLEEPAVRFLVAVPSPFFPDYEVELDDDTCAALELESADDALVLVVLTVGDGSDATTANLLAPVVINARTRAAAQVILSGTSWPVRATIG